MVKLEKSVQNNLNDLHDNHKMMISMKSASDKSKAVADDVEKLTDDINFETLHINKVRNRPFSKKMQFFVRKSAIYHFYIQITVIFESNLTIFGCFWVKGIIFG